MDWSGGRSGGPNIPDTFPASLSTTLQWGPALTAGGGMDYDLPFFEQPLSTAAVSRRTTAISMPTTVRLYLRFRRTLGGRANLSGVELSTGIVIALRPHRSSSAGDLCLRCVAHSVYPGDPVTVTGTALNLDPKKTARTPGPRRRHDLRYFEHCELSPPRTLSAWNLTVKGHVSEGAKPGMMADCTAPLHGEGIRAADHYLLGESVDGEPGRSFHHHCYWHKPAESSSDLQLQRDGWFDQRQYLFGDPVDRRCGSGHASP